MPRKRSRHRAESFQMAPMIDMVFLLLVFFMTVSTMAKDARPELDLAVSRSATVPESAPARDIVTVQAVEKGYRIYWSNREVKAADLPQLLKQSRESGCAELLLRGGPDLPWEAWQGVFNDCRGAGFKDIVFATFED